MGLNTPVLLIFFNRPETFIKVFNRVKAAQPKQLFLFQDGSRGNSEEDLRINTCKEIVESIDWECEIHKNYLSSNIGCGLGPSTAITWAFQYVNELIILEDDCIPETTFFSYCELLLEKYRDDKRISYISGLNHFIKWNYSDSDYFFTRTGSIWGWALWKRSWELYDFYLQKEIGMYTLKNIEKEIPNREVYTRKIKDWEYVKTAKERNVRLSFWDIQWGFVKYSQNQLVIVPKYNQISNIGVGHFSTHAKGVNQVNHIQGKNFFFLPTYKMSFPIKHPDYIVTDHLYDSLVYKKSKTPFITKIKLIIKGMLKK